MRSRSASTGSACAAVVGADSLVVIDALRRRDIRSGNRAASAMITLETITGGVAGDRTIGLGSIASGIGVEVAFLARAIDSALIGIIVNGAAGAEQAEHGDGGE